jgi:hypothetical protein
MSKRLFPLFPERQGNVPVRAGCHPAPEQQSLTPGAYSHPWFLSFSKVFGRNSVKRSFSLFPERLTVTRRLSSCTRTPKPITGSLFPLQIFKSKQGVGANDVKKQHYPFPQNGKEMHLYAPVVILHQDDKANHGVPIPIAIKLSQGEDQIITPGGDTSEGKWGWTLAKVRNLNRSICRLPYPEE